MTRALILVSLLSAPPAWGFKPLVETVAAYVGVPGDILYGIALTESGTTVDGEYLPWPWTLNVAGEPRRYPNREAMFADLMTALGAGTLNIDIGPMQLNWYWQFSETMSPWRITDPAENLKLAAQVLKQQFEHCGDWWEAVGRYHRPAQTLASKAMAQRYRERVRERLSAENAKRPVSVEHAEKGEHADSHSTTRAMKDA